MNGCFRCLALIALGMFVAAVPAEAKSIHLGEFARSTIATSCARARGSSYGIHDETAEYGCRGENANVVCTIEGDCFALVSDTTPLTGNSLDVILGIRRSGDAHRIKAVDSRVQP